MEHTLKFSSTNPTANDIIQLHLKIKRSNILDIREYDNYCYIRYEERDKYYPTSKIINIGDFAHIEDGQIILKGEYTADIRNMPIWNKLKTYNTILERFIQNQKIEDVTFRIDQVLSLSKYSEVISPHSATRFLYIREILNNKLNNKQSISTQIIILAGMMQLFFDNFKTASNGTANLSYTFDLFKRLKDLEDINILLEQVDKNKYIPDKSSCLKRFGTKDGTYYIFTCGIQILKTRNFKVFAKMPELQILHLAANYKLRDLV